MRILLAGGTSEGRTAAAHLAAQGHDVLVSVYDPAAASSLGDLPVRVVSGAKDVAAFFDLIVREKLQAVVDAGHPFAEALHATLRKAARDAGVPYLRFGRLPVVLPAHPRLHQVSDHEEACRILPELGRVALLTVGVKPLPFYLPARQWGVRLVARCLPRPRSLEAAERLGFRPEDLLAMKGPFSVEENIAHLRRFAADILVTKESGSEGGLRAKLEAAEREGVAVVVVRRPPEDDVLTSLDLLEQRLEEVRPFVPFAPKAPRERGWG